MSTVIHINILTRRFSSNGDGFVLLNSHRIRINKPPDYRTIDHIHHKPFTNSSKYTNPHTNPPLG